MSEKIVFIAIDVDDKSFHVAFSSNDNQLIGRFATRPNVSALTKKLMESRFEGYKIRICYEATYLGFSLWRDLKKNGFDCSVISPHLIPKVAGQAQKTDRLDAERLVGYFRNGLVTPIFVPTEDDEGNRALLRGREGVCQQVRSVKRQILGLCRVSGFHYREITKENHKFANYWTVRHLKWLDSMIKSTSNPSLKLHFNLLLVNLNQLQELMAKYDSEIEKLSLQEPYSRKVGALRAFRGIDTLTAMTITLEVGDIKRFDHPKKFASFAGFDIREYSSGGKENKFGISKIGNKYIRTRVVEASQTVFRPPKVSKFLQARRNEVDAKTIAIADKCMMRLHSKAHKLIHKGKHRNVIKAACAREMLCFVWEALQNVS